MAIRRTYGVARIPAAEDAFFVDCGGTLDGRNTGNTTLELALTGGANWDSGNLATLYASAGIFIAPDEGRVFNPADGDDHRVAVRVGAIFVGARPAAGGAAARCPESLRDVQTKDGPLPLHKWAD